jgi:Acetyl co-enzyme A carboxylase carboxyltransferase-like
MRDYLEFEKPIREIEEKIEKLAAVPAGKSAPQDEIRKLRMKLAQVEDTLYSKLTPWQRTQLARHPQRPSTLDYIMATARSATIAPSSEASLDSTTGRSWSSDIKKGKPSKSGCNGTLVCRTPKAIEKLCVS